MDNAASKDVMIFLNNSEKSFHCECGGNVFRKVENLSFKKSPVYKCNSCRATYWGAKEVV
jgi:predicted SprT family Zn-dependent metalloprotease